MKLNRRTFTFLAMLIGASVLFANCAQFSSTSWLVLLALAYFVGLMVYPESGRAQQYQMRYGYLYTLLLVILSGFIWLDRHEDMGTTTSIIVTIVGMVVFYVLYDVMEGIVLDAVMRTGLLDWFAYPDKRARVFDAIAIASWYGLLGWASAWAVNGTRADHYGLAVAGVLAALAFFAAWGYGSLLAGSMLLCMVGFIALGDAILHQGAWGVGYAAAGIAAYILVVLALFIWAVAQEDKAMMEYDHGYAY